MRKLIAAMAVGVALAGCGPGIQNTSDQKTNGYPQTQTVSSPLEHLKDREMDLSVSSMGKLNDRLPLEVFLRVLIGRLSSEKEQFFLEISSVSEWKRKMPIILNGKINALKALETICSKYDLAYSVITSNHSNNLLGYYTMKITEKENQGIAAKESQRAVADYEQHKRLFWNDGDTLTLKGVAPSGKSVIPRGMIWDLTLGVGLVRSQRVDITVELLHRRSKALEDALDETKYDVIKTKTITAGQSDKIRDMTFSFILDDNCGINGLAIYALGIDSAGDLTLRNRYDFTIDLKVQENKPESEKYWTLCLDPKSSLK